MKEKFIPSVLCLALVPGALNVESKGSFASRSSKLARNSRESRLWSLAGLGGRKNEGIRSKIKYAFGLGSGFAATYGAVKTFPTAKVLLTEKITGERSKWVDENIPSGINEDVKNFFRDPLVDLSFLENDKTKIEKTALFLDSIKKKYDGTGGVFKIDGFSSDVDLKESELDGYISAVSRIPFSSASKYLFPKESPDSNISNFLVALTAHECSVISDKWKDSRVARKVSQDTKKSWDMIWKSFKEKGYDILKQSADAFPQMVNTTNSNIFLKLSVNVLGVVLKSFLNDNNNKNKYSTGNG